MASLRKRVLPSGKTAWQCDYQDAAGRRRSKQFSTKRDADAFLVQARAEVAAGTYIHAADSVTIAAAADLWLKSCAVRRDAGLEMEATTYVGYECQVRRHVKDSEIGVGRLKLANLKTKTVMDFRDRLLSSGRSVSLTRRTLAILQMIIKHARTQGLIATNPTEGVHVKKGSRSSNQIKPPSKETVRRLIEAADDDFKPYLIVAALCGLRASEQRGLRWCDVDIENRDVDPENRYMRIRQRADSFNTIGEPKSLAGHRSIPIGPLVVNTLRRWKIRVVPSPLDLVFPNAKGQVRTQKDVYRLHFTPLCEQLEVKMRWHDLRHYAVSIWIEQGFDVKAIMSFAGHSDYRMTMERYGHLFPSPEHHKAMAEIERKLLR